MIYLRPHHLLCTQGYSGKGYNDAFTEGMTRIVEQLRHGEDDEVTIVYHCDMICENCPEKLGFDLCEDQDKVKRYDNAVISNFNIEQKRYHYREIIQEIDSKMTPELFESICGDCCWYPISACRERIALADQKLKYKNVDTPEKDMTAHIISNADTTALGTVGTNRSSCRFLNPRQITNDSTR